MRVQSARIREINTIFLFYLSLEVDISVDIMAAFLIKP